MYTFSKHLLSNEGEENYENQLKFGQEIFHELENINDTGYYFHGIHHTIQVISCCDWKAGACLEGMHTMSIVFSQIIYTGP